MPIGIAREDSGNSHKETSVFQVKFLSIIADLEDDADKEFLKNLHNVETIGYGTSLGNCPEFFPDKTKQRVYADQRSFLGNYKTVLGKEGIYKKSSIKT